MKNLFVKTARLLKIAVAVCLSAFIVLFVALWVFSPSPTVRYYENYREVMQSDPVKRSWMPNFLPKSATKIHVVYGVDPSFERLEFYYNPADKRQMTETFRLVTDTAEANNVLENMNRKAWSHFDTSGAMLVYVPKEAVRNSLFSPDIYLAIDPKIGVAWYTLDK